MGIRTRRRNASGGSITISTTVSRPLWDAAQEAGLQWSECLRIGVTYLLSKGGDDRFQNPMQMERKIAALAQRIQEVADEKSALDEELARLRK